LLIKTVFFLSKISQFANEIKRGRPNANSKTN